MAWHCVIAPVMPSGIAEAVRQQFATASKAGLVVQESRQSRTGYTNVIEVRGKYQARLQVKGDGRLTGSGNAVMGGH